MLHYPRRGSRTGHVQEGGITRCSIGRDRDGHLEILKEGLALVHLPRGHDGGIHRSPERRGVDPVRLGEPEADHEVRDRYDFPSLHYLGPLILWGVRPELCRICVDGVGGLDGGDGGDVHLVREEVEHVPRELHNVAVVTNQFPFEGKIFVGQIGVIVGQPVFPAEGTIVDSGSLAGDNGGGNKLTLCSRLCEAIL